MPGSSFEIGAVDAFRFLTEFGYRLTDASRWRVVYARHDVIVLITYDATRSYELSVAIGRSDNDTFFDLGEALDGCGAPPDTPSAFQVVDMAKIAIFAGRLAQSLKKHCAPLLQGDCDAFRRVERCRDEQSDACAQSRNMIRIREQAARAWANKNYEQVAALFGLCESLTPAEHAKLDYARKHIQRTD